MLFSKNVSITWCFPRFLRMLLACCAHVAFPKRFNNLVFSQVFVHVALMLSPCCFPKTFQEPGVFPGFCACFACCVHVAFRNVSRTWCFPRFLRMFLHVASMLLSKTLQEPGDSPGFCACCVHVAFQKVSRTWCFPRFLRMLLSCCFHVLPMLLSKKF